MTTDAPQALAIQAVRYMANGDVRLVLSNGALLVGPDHIVLDSRKGETTCLRISQHGVRVEVEGGERLHVASDQGEGRE